MPGFDYSFKLKNYTKSIVIISLGITKAQYAILENKAYILLEKRQTFCRDTSLPPILRSK